MLKHGDWECAVMNDPEDIDKLALDILYKDETVIFIKEKGSEKIITIYEKDLVIPFDWFVEVMKLAKDRVP